LVFKGIFVCATNLREKLDAAVFRRFDFKIKLDYLKVAQGWEFFQDLAKALKLRLSSREVQGLKARIALLQHLAPGDFAVIRRKALMQEKKLMPVCSWLGWNKRLNPSP
jgi:transitional endoplasmic reticulum ATPase